jgi:hypothetical protein
MQIEFYHLRRAMPPGLNEFEHLKFRIFFNHTRFLLIIDLEIYVIGY